MSKPDKDSIRQAVREALEQRETPTGKSRFDDESFAFSGRALITEEDVMAAHRQGRDLTIPPDTIVTPLARDAIDRYKVTVHEGSKSGQSSPPLKSAPTPSEPTNGTCHAGRVALGCDHGGFELKEALKKFIESDMGIECRDLGTHSTDSVDYPDFARKVADTVSRGDCCRGIVIDGAGIGSAMVANKVRGIRAANPSNVTEARNAREHNDANVLSLGGQMIGAQLARAITVIFLKTPFEGGRHQRRVAKIMDTES